MDSYISKFGYNFLLEKVDLPKELRNIVNSEFLNENDTIILKGLYGHETIPKFDNDIEKCEWEYNETHFHPDMFAKNTDNETIYLKLALEGAKQIMERLTKQFNGRKFKVIVSFSETKTENGEIASYGSSTVRFYQIRSSCEDRMRHPNLDNFREDAVLEIEN
jgi:hypothetical protein